MLDRNAYFETEKSLTYLNSEREREREMEDLKVR